MSGSAPPSPEELAAYTNGLFGDEDSLLRALRVEIERRGMPLIQVPAITGRTLQVLAAAVGARRVLEVGTLGGYSAIWIARGMAPGSSLLSIELNEDHAVLAREFLAKAGLDDVVEVLVGDGREVLPGLGPDGSYDMVFLDADKEGYVEYLTHAARLLRPGGLVAADNALWRGHVVETASDDPTTRAIQTFNEALAASTDFLGTILPVGDGVAVGVRR